MQTHNIFQYHNGVIDEHPDPESQTAEGHSIDRVSAEINQNECRNDGKRDTDRNNQRTAEITEEVDLRVQVGNDILRVYEVALGEQSHYNHATGESEVLPTVQVSVCAYNRIPFGIVSGDLFTYLKAADQRGTEVDTWGGGAGSWGAEYDRYYIPIESGDTYVTLSYDRFGESVELKVPLPEVTP